MLDQLKGAAAVTILMPCEDGCARAFCHRDHYGIVCVIRGVEVGLYMPGCVHANIVLFNTSKSASVRAMEHLSFIFGIELISIREFRKRVDFVPDNYLDWSVRGYNHLNSWIDWGAYQKDKPGRRCIGCKRLRHELGVVHIIDDGRSEPFMICSDCAPRVTDRRRRHAITKFSPIEDDALDFIQLSLAIRKEKS